MIKTFSFILSLIFGICGFDTLVNMPKLDRFSDIENKVVFCLNDKDDLSIGTDSCVNSHELQVAFQYDDDFVCDSEPIDSDFALMSHRNKLAKYYQTKNRLRLNTIKLNNYEDVYISSYSPFIIFKYKSKENFLDKDYEKLARSDSNDLSKIYVESIENIDMASRNADPSDTYPFNDALEDIGIGQSTVYDGTGVKIGSIESGIPDNYSNLSGETYETFGTDKTTHAFHTSSIYASNAGIASDADIYFAALKNHSFVECGDWLISKGVNIINRSNGQNGGVYTSNSAYADYLTKETKVLFSISAGNDGNANIINEPSTGINVISVASNDVNLSISNFSSAGLQTPEKDILKKPTLTAPGGAINGIPNVAGSISGTSFSAPMVTGVAALLMEEYPQLKYHPEALMAILANSTTYINGQDDKWDHDAGFGLLNYERAREAASNYGHGILTSSSTTATPIFTENITIPTGNTIYFNSNILFNALKTSTISSINFSGFTASLKDSSNNVVASLTNYSNFSSLVYSNDTLNENFSLSFSIAQNKTDSSYEYFGYCYYISDEFDAQISLIAPANEADIAPMITWQKSTRGTIYPHHYYSLIFLDGNGSEITRIENILRSVNSYVLREATWNRIISSPGQNYKVIVGYVNDYGDIPDYYSEARTFSKPTISTMDKTIIYPNQYGFPESYGGNEDILKSFDAGGFHFDTVRRRCGYIQNKVINLSARKEGAGEAFLQYTIDSTVYRADFDLAFWSNKEYFSGPFCKAYI